MTLFKDDERKIGILALFPIIMTILDPYSLTEGGMSICQILILLMAAWLLLKKKISFFLPLLLVLGIDILLSIVSFFFTASSRTDVALSFKNAIIYLLYLFAYSSIWSQDVKHGFFVWAEIIGIICAILAILQFVFASMGFDFYDGRLFLPLAEGTHFGGLFDKNTGDLRVHSFFEEPSYLAFFELPIVAHLVQQKKYISAIICSVACVLSGSLLGILGLIVVLVAIVLLDSHVSMRRKALLLVLLLLIILVGIAVYNNNQSFKTLWDYYFKRLSNVDASSDRENSSFSQRIIGNIALFDQYSPFNKFVGLGFNQYAIYFGLTKDYSNDLVSNLLNFGYIGIAALGVSLIMIFNKAKGHGTVFAVLFLLLLAVDHAWFGAMFFYILTWVITKSSKQSGIFLTVEY